MQNSKIEDLKQSIDSIEAAIAHLETARDNGQLSLLNTATVVVELYNIRLELMLQVRAAQRSAKSDVAKARGDVAKFDRHLMDEYFN